MAIILCRRCRWPVFKFFWLRERLFYVRDVRCRSFLINMGEDPRTSFEKIRQYTLQSIGPLATWWLTCSTAGQLPRNAQLGARVCLLQDRSAGVYMYPYFYIYLVSHWNHSSDVVCIVFSIVHAWNNWYIYRTLYIHCCNWGIQGVGVGIAQNASSGAPEMQFEQGPDYFQCYWQCPYKNRNPNPIYLSNQMLKKVLLISTIQINSFM